MKASLILLFAFFAIALCGRSNLRPTRAYQQKCSAIHCEKSGETCGYVDLQTNFIATGCIKADTEYCNVTQTGNGIQVGQCLAYATLGQSCSILKCGLGLTCSGFISPTCVAVSSVNITRQPGQPCGASNIVCQYGSPLSLNENTCNGGVCKFNADGTSCNDGYTQCKVGSRCLSAGITGFTCQPRFAKGSTCVANATDTNQCQEFLNCIPSGATTNPAGTCRDRYTQKEKAACRDDSDCKDGVCSPPDGVEGVVIFGVCKDYKKTSTINQRCANDADCTSGNGESCVCVDEDKSVCKNTNFKREYFDEYKDFLACREDAEVKCGGIEGRQSLKCYLSECKKEYCKLYKGAKKEGDGEIVDELLDGASGTGAICALVQVCDASSLFTSLPLLAAIATIVLLLQ